MTITSLATLVSTVIVIAMFVAGIWQYRRSVHINIFRTYADKFNSIVTADKYDKWGAALAGEKDYWEELTPTMIEYLNLIWEEFFLLKAGIMPRYLWRLWLPGIRCVLVTDFARATIERYDFHFPTNLTSGS